MILPSSLMVGGETRALLRLEEHQLWPILDQSCKDAVLRVLDRGVLSGNFAPESMAFQEEFADFVGAKHALLTHSGTSALVIALAAAGLGPGDEVIVPAYTFVATPQAVLAVGATPVFADVDPDTGNILTSEAERWATERTKAILVVHVHGDPADLTALGAFAKRRGLLLIEDAAQAHGATYEGRPVGALFSGGAFSLQSSKNLGAGEGGVYVTSDLGQAEAANQVRNFGHDLSLAEATHGDPRHPLDGTRSLDSRRTGGMFRGNEMMAALARALLAKLPERTRACQANAKRLSASLRALPGVLPPPEAANREGVYHKYRVRFDADAAGLGDFAPVTIRDAILRALKATGFEATLWERHAQAQHSIFRRAEPADPRLRENYQATFGNTEALLASSFLLFSQSYPLIGQSAELVDKYANAFGEVWAERRAIVEAYAASVSR